MSEKLSQSGTPSDYLDTGQWHLAVDISRFGLGAWLLPDESIARPPRTIISKTWQPSEEGLLGRIEETVYDNPTVLDDYSADIVVECDRQLWLPSQLYPADEDCAEVFSEVYGSNMLEVMVNSVGNEKCCFMLIPGLKSFMQRSFPGARIWSQQALLKEAALQPHDAYKCIIDIREASFDMILLHRGDLLSASTHQWKTDADIAYMLLNILNTYDAPSENTEIVFSGIKDTRRNLGKILTPYFKNISQKSHDLDGKEIPTAVYLAINRKQKYAYHTR